MNQMPAELPGVEPNDRLKAIFARTVEKMKEVVREFEITQDELHVAGDYFNRLGRSGFCRSLIDVALAMTSVDATARVPGGKIGRASCRERVCQSVEISVVAVSLKKKKRK